jgi:polysaccharide pyruvyl transferase CsaB
MHKIVISGYYGFNNVGDESILISIVNNLKKSISDLEITVLSVNPQSTARKHSVHSIDRKNLWQIYKEIRNCDVLISGGGSLLQDVTSRRSIIYYLAIMLIAIFLKKKVLIYSQGIGPINRKLNKLMVRWVLNKVDCITVRDDKSQEELKSLGVCIPPIYVTADPVISLEKGDVEAGKEILIREGMGKYDSRPLIGFAIRGWRKDERLKKTICETADSLISQYGMNVVFIPFHFGEDIKILQEIEKEMKHKAIFIKNRYDIKTMLGIVGNLELLVGVRLHSLIFAAIMNVPMIAVSYDPKIDSFIRSLGFDVLCEVNELETEMLLEAVEEKRNCYEQDKKILADAVQQLQEKVHMNEMLLTQLLT